MLVGRATWGIASPFTKHLLVNDYLCIPIILRCRFQYTHFPIYADNTRCIEHKALIGGWLWCLIHSLTWQWPLKMPLGCLQKVGKQIEMFSIFLRLIYQPPASLSLIVEAQKRLVFRVLFSVGLSLASDISCF